MYLVEVPHDWCMSSTRGIVSFALAIFVCCYIQVDRELDFMLEIQTNRYSTMLLMVVANAGMPIITEGGRGQQTLTPNVVCPG